MVKIIARVKDADGHYMTKSISTKNNTMFLVSQVDKIKMNTFNLAKHGVVSISYQITPVHGDTFDKLGRISKISGKTMVMQNATLPNVYRVYDTMLREIESQLKKL